MEEIVGDQTNKQTKTTLGFKVTEVEFEFCIYESFPERQTIRMCIYIERETGGERFILRNWSRLLWKSKIYRVDKQARDPGKQCSLCLKTVSRQDSFLLVELCIPHSVLH